MMERLKAFFLCAFLAGLTFACVSAGLAALALRAAPAMLSGILQEETHAIRAEAAKSIAEGMAIAQQEIASTRAAAVREISGLRRDVRTQAESSTAILDNHAGRLEAILSEQADRYRATLDSQLARTNASVEQIASVASPVRATAEQVALAAPLWLDCDHNADCAFNRYVGVARSVERTSQAISAAAPRTAESIAGIASAGDKIATNLAKDQPWWKKALSAAPIVGWLFSTLNK